MPRLSFSVLSVAAVEHAAAPALSFELRASNVPADEVLHGVLLRCQLRLEPQARTYSDAGAEGLHELFGGRDRWSETLRPLLWTHTQAMVPAFRGDATFELPVPCSYDFNLAVTRYFHALADGEVPVMFLFSGTVFYEAGGALQVVQVPWTCEARWRMPVAAWKRMMDHYYPASASVLLRRDVFDRLDRYRRDRRLTDLDQAVERLLEEPR